jgi:hypothetical protein
MNAGTYTWGAVSEAHALYTRHEVLAYKPTTAQCPASDCQ